MSIPQGSIIRILSPGDMRPAACKTCWPMQEETLKYIEQVLCALGFKPVRGVPEAAQRRGHEFVTRQAEGMEIVSQFSPDDPVILVMSCWAYADHLAGPLKNHRGPILMLANFDGTWPGLVALLNHSATFWRMGIKHSRAWSDKLADAFADSFFAKALERWIESGEIAYNTSHVLDASSYAATGQQLAVAEALIASIRRNPRVLGILDAGSCMGMLNALFDPGLAAAVGLSVQYLSQAELLARMGAVGFDAAYQHLKFIEDAGATLHLGPNGAEHLTREQLIMQMAMYEAAVRMVEFHKLAGIGIPYQRGLGALGLNEEYAGTSFSESCIASDLVEGTLNNADRPRVIIPGQSAPFRDGIPIPHGNEGDLGSLMPQVLMQEILLALGMPPEATLHDFRWGRQWQDMFVWVLLISGGAPPAHYGGWKNTHIYRQPPMYFPKGGGTCSGVTLPGVITWARAFQLNGELYMDLGLGDVIEMPVDEVQDRLNKTTPVWPIANVHIPGYGRDEAMASHMSNHITICRGDILAPMVHVCNGLGFKTRVVGDAGAKLLAA